MSSDLAAGDLGPDLENSLCLKLKHVEGQLHFNSKQMSISCQVSRACVKTLSITNFLIKRTKKNELKERCTEGKTQKEHFFLSPQQQSWEIYYKSPFPYSLLKLVYFYNMHNNSKAFIGVSQTSTHIRITWGNAKKKPQCTGCTLKTDNLKYNILCANIFHSIVLTATGDIFLNQWLS